MTTEGALAEWEVEMAVGILLSSMILAHGDGDTSEFPQAWRWPHTPALLLSPQLHSFPPLYHPLSWLCLGFSVLEQVIVFP